MNLIYKPFELLLKGCLYISGDSYFLALFFFALAIQIILLPLAIKQHKSQIKMAEIKPKEMAIREKYKGRTDKVTQQRMTMEIQQMYQENGYSQFSGCLPMLIQLPIVLILFSIVRQPITYAYTGSEAIDINKERIEAYVFYGEALKSLEAEKNLYVTANKETHNQGASLDEYNNKIAEFDKTIESFKGYQTTLKVTVDDKGVATIDQKKMGTDQNIEVALTRLFCDGKGDMEELVEKELIDESILKLYNDKNFERFKSGLPNYWIGPFNLINEPDFGANIWLMIIPLFVFLSSFFSTKITRKFSAAATATGPDGKPVGGGLFMEVGMPLISAIFAYSMSAAVGVYWIWRTVLGVVQTVVLAKAMPIPAVTAEKIAEAKKEMKAKQKPKKIITIEVDEDDDSYDHIMVQGGNKGGNSAQSEDPARRTPRRIEMLTEDDDVTETASEEETDSDNTNE